MYLVWVKMEIILISSHVYQYVSLAMVRLGLIFTKIKNWKKSKYSSWIKMYSSKEYQQVAKDNIDYLDILLKNNKGKKLNTLKRNFKKSTILERNFWECFV